MAIIHFFLQNVFIHPLNFKTKGIYTHVIIILFLKTKKVHGPPFKLAGCLIKAKSGLW